MDSALWEMLQTSVVPFAEGASLQSVELSNEAVIMYIKRMYARGRVDGSNTLMSSQIMSR